MAALKTGNIAPAFTLQDQNGNKISLKDFKGKKNIVLYFYPKAMTPGCTVQDALSGIFRDLIQNFFDVNSKRF